MYKLWPGQIQTDARMHAQHMQISKLSQLCLAHHKRARQKSYL